MAGSRRFWGAASRGGVAWAFVGVAILYLAIGATWTWLNLLDLPPYGDSQRYRWFTETWTVDQFHGGLYPLVLSLANPWSGKLGQLQLLQFGVLALCLSYFVYALRGADFAADGYGRRGIVGAFVSLLLLLLFDPLLAHFALSVMPDSLALSGCLAFSAALAELMRDGVRRWLAAGVLALGFALAAGVRVEKSWVLLATVLSVLPLWFVGARSFLLAPPARLRARGVLVLAIVLLGLGSVQWLNTSMYREPPRTKAFEFSRWPILTTVLHHRIVFPNLSSVYEDLSPESRGMLTREDARSYDQRLHNTWKVIDRVTHQDLETRDRLTRDLASTAFRRRWAVIAADVAGDTAENLLAPLSFYLRLVTWSIGGADPDLWPERFEATPWTYGRLAQHHPRISRLYLLVSGILFLFASCLALLHARASFRAGSWRPTPQTLFSLLPVVVLSTANAFAFSLSADLVHPRYTLFAHTAALLLVYRGALAWVASARPIRQEAQA
ncbi:MAG: hypothetical protein HRU00_00060 [Myxococcales bacterium]|nr:hypothetical protein [Myxococcales bacterium]